MIAVSLNVQNMLLREQFSQHQKQPALARTTIASDTDRKGTAPSAVKRITVHAIQIHRYHQDQKDADHQCEKDIVQIFFHTFHPVQPFAQD